MWLMMIYMNAYRIVKTIYSEFISLYDENFSVNPLIMMKVSLILILNTKSLRFEVFVVP